MFLNRKFIGRHLGGSTPFYIDITAYLERENRIHILVDNTHKSSAVPKIDIIDGKAHLFY